MLNYSNGILLQGCNNEVYTPNSVLNGRYITRKPCKKHKVRKRQFKF